MRKDHRPLFIKDLEARYIRWYTDHYLRPQFKHLGKHPTIIRPSCVEVFGYNVSLGDHAMVIADPESKVHLVSWAQTDLEELSELIEENNGGKPHRKKKKENWAGKGVIDIGDYVLICPAVRIHSATSITIGNGAMLAHSAYITDSDWHGIYDRAQPVGSTAPVVIGENAWIGDRAIVCKGVTVGKNAIVGAGSVVVRDVPENAVAAGNPARVVKELDPSRPVTGREILYRNFEEMQRLLGAADKNAHGANTFLGWVRHMLFPGKND